MNNSNKSYKSKVNTNFTYVILNKQFEDFRNEEIINEFGQIIGKIKTNLFTQNKKLEFQDLKNENFFFLERKNSFLYKSYILKGQAGKIIGTVKKKRFLIKSSRIKLEIDKESKHYTAMGDFKNWNYKIIDTSNNKIAAKVKIYEEELSSIYDLDINSSNCFLLEFINKNIDKFIIASFVISINDLIHYQRNLSDIFGIERRIARLRPFGPGKSLN
ncbi:MAG: LURP-one-related family protein [Promethearchaeota archaeon]